MAELFYLKEVQQWLGLIFCQVIRLAIYKSRSKLREIIEGQFIPFQRLILSIILLYLMDKEARTSFIRKQITSADVKKTPLSDLKPNQIPQHKSKIDRKILNADKQNIATGENIQQHLTLNKFPKLSKNGPKQLLIRSPDKPIYMPSGFRSNKANQCVVNVNQELSKAAEVTTIFSGMSKDGKYQILSKAFIGRELQKARIFELKTCNKLRQKGEVETLTDDKIPKIDESKTSAKQNGFVKSYAVNTHQGIARNYNEDRVSIILNINKSGVKSTFFAVYDGHGGSGCCDFLRDYLHEYIINHQCFPAEPKKAIVEGIHRVEAKFTQLAKKKFAKTGQLDKSGSCAIIVMIVGKQCFAVNVGDSRAFLSKNCGKVISHLSRDHKPSDEKEQKRIILNGGKIYRTQMTKIDKVHVEDKSTLTNQQFIVGPLRVFPGKLSVTRTLGDIEAKDPEFDGIPHCISYEPEIATFTIDKNDDFLFLGCDGIFQKLESVEVSKMIWRVINQNPMESIHKVTGKCVDEVIKQSMRRKSTDNLTAIMINLKDVFNQSSINQQRSLIRDTSCRSL